MIQPPESDTQHQNVDGTVDKQDLEIRHTHVLSENKIVCGTEDRGFKQPRGASREELVLDNTEGFIPLWDKNVTLRWRFNRSIQARLDGLGQTPDTLRKLIGEAVLGWGDAVPVKFVERDDAYDFEIDVREADRCSPSGCVLASAFFPDAGRHELKIYPKMFAQSKKEQVETLMHEFGHVFGLRHFFAQLSEKEWPAVIFGEHNPFSIMNYGENSFPTDADRRDLRKLYEGVWGGQIKNINGTEIRLMRPYHESGSENNQLVTLIAFLKKSIFS
jgi:hypothetical protein